MIRNRTIATLLAATCAASPLAWAQPQHKILVLRVDGKADDATRARIDTVVLRLAKHLPAPAQVTLGDITLTEAETAVGCTGDLGACKDDVLSTLGADEIVATRVEPNGPDLQVVVMRASKNAPIKSASIPIAAGETRDTPLERGFGPLFGVAIAAEPEHREPVPATANPSSPTAPPVVVPPPTSVTPPPASTVTVTAAPTNVIVDDPHPHRARHNLELVGMAGGGVLAVLGILSWAAAYNTQQSINAAPIATAADLTYLKSLESKGDGQAGLGNVLFVGGLVIGGVSAIFYLHDRFAGHTVSVAPAPMDHGAGITFTIGGSP